MRFGAACLILLLFLSIIFVVGEVERGHLEAGSPSVRSLPISEPHAIPTPKLVLAYEEAAVLFQYGHASAEPTISISPTTCQAGVQASILIIGWGFIPHQTGWIIIEGDEHTENFMASSDPSGSWSHNQTYYSTTPGTKKVLASQAIYAVNGQEAIAYLTVTGPAPLRITTAPTPAPIAPVAVSIASISIVVILTAVVLRKRADSPRPKNDELSTGSSAPRETSVEDRLGFKD